MSWFRVDDHLTFHPKVLAAGNEAIGAWTRLGAYCGAYLTDGFVPVDIVDSVCASKKLKQHMIDRGLLESVDGGYHLHDYLEYNLSREQVEAERRATRDRQSRRRQSVTPLVTPLHTPLVTPREQPVTNAAQSDPIRSDPYQSDPIPSESADLTHAHVGAEDLRREQVNATKIAWAKAKLPANGNDWEMGILSDEIQSAKEVGEAAGEPIPTLDEIMHGLKSVTDDWAKNGRHTKFQPSKLKDSIGLAIQVARGKVKLGTKSGGVAPKGTFTRDRDATEDV